MSIKPLTRLVSNQDTYVRAERKEAVKSVLNDLFASKPSFKDSLVLTTIPPTYPRLKEFNNDNSRIAKKSSEPRFIWGANHLQEEETLFFAKGIVLNPREISQDMVIYLQSLSNNAYKVRISLYDQKKNKLCDITPPGDLLDGDMDVILGNNPDNDYSGAQYIRYYSNTFEPSKAEKSIALVLTFETINLSQFTSSIFSPAALAFVADFYAERCQK